MLLAWYFGYYSIPSQPHHLNHIRRLLSYIVWIMKSLSGNSVLFHSYCFDSMNYNLPTPNEIMRDRNILLTLIITSWDDLDKPHCFDAGVKRQYVENICKRKTCIRYLTNWYKKGYLFTLVKSVIFSLNDFLWVILIHYMIRVLMVTWWRKIGN